MASLAGSAEASCVDGTEAAIDLAAHAADNASSGSLAACICCVHCNEDLCLSPLCKQYGISAVYICASLLIDGAAITCLGSHACTRLLRALGAGSAKQNAHDCAVSNLADAVPG